MIFLDFEASGLNGFPIEIGWAVVNSDRRVVVESHYIHCERWMVRIDLWDHKAEAIHRIPRRLLMEIGRSPVEVAHRANEALAGMIVCADSNYDRVWAAQLFSEAGVGQRFSIADISIAFGGSEIDGVAHRFARKIADLEYPMNHSAGADARHWAELYRMSLKDDAAPRRLDM